MDDAFLRGWDSWGCVHEERITWDRPLLRESWTATHSQLQYHGVELSPLNVVESVLQQQDGMFCMRTSSLQSAHANNTLLVGACRTNCVIKRQGRKKWDEIRERFEWKHSHRGDAGNFCKGQKIGIGRLHFAFAVVQTGDYAHHNLALTTQPQYNSITTPNMLFLIATSVFVELEILQLELWSLRIAQNGGVGFTFLSPSSTTSEKVNINLRDPSSGSTQST